MTDICEKFSIQCKLKFSTSNPSKSKTKCMIFNKSNINVNNVCPIFLNGVPLPYVKDFKHKNSIAKRAKFFSIEHSLNQEFHFSDSSYTQLVSTVQTYGICFVIIQLKFIRHGILPFVFYSIYPGKFTDISFHF